MRKTPLRLSGLTAAALLAVAPGCGSGGGGGTPPPSTTPPDAPPPTDPAPGTGGATSVELTHFARTLVEQDTSDTAKPREIGGTTFVDSEDANAFTDSFFTPQ
ncbi:hypothetical protein FGE12_15400 [Aggregicoccus sp. 17bor-14]|uniref:hypothetical protein n=1 Tax=Myxococcaceae TaxID=31 RepID=UPI00129C49F4|nr:MULTISPECIES: hypothetical protein [Myxococcaceae]MBF5043782.1 hypothetical protein [Simulacricoccus sp. 17bor-14]MRI89536.1 hypothetical protein [Aggregicoccus sp. 17bor-14]